METISSTDVRDIQLRIVRDFFSRRVLMQALGIDGKKLPTDARPVRWWYGLQIYLREQEPAPVNQYGRKVHRKHPMRLRVICTCGADICFGRLAQHLRYKHKAGA